MFLSNDETVADESAARPRLLPARERKSRRVRSCTPLIRAIPRIACNHCLPDEPQAVAAATTKLWRASPAIMWPQQSLPAVAGEPSLNNQLSTMPGLPLPLKQLAKALSRRHAVEFARRHIDSRMLSLLR